jgi:hypothetical protein
MELPIEAASNDESGGVALNRAQRTHKAKLPSAWPRGASFLRVVRFVRRNSDLQLSLTVDYGVGFGAGFFAKSPARTITMFFGSTYFFSAALT